MDNLPPVVTIDGPGGSGKGTISYLLAKALGWHFLDSGLLYRALAYVALAEKLNLTQEKELASLAFNLDVRFNDGVYYKEKEIKDLIRTEYNGNIASQIAVFPAVRKALLERQRAFRQPPGLVADGRDMGTQVFKDANLKIFLEASPEERAKRRFLQLKNQAGDVTLQTLLIEIKERDRRDRERAVAPLRPAEDAVVIDTTHLGIEQVLDLVKNLVKQRLYVS